MPEKSLKKNAVLNAIRTVMSLIFPLITFPYASRILLPDGIGRVNFAHYVVSFVYLIASLGISSYGIREVAKVRDNKESLNNLVKEIFSIHFFSTITAYIVFFVILFAVPKFYEYRSLLLICASSMIFSLIGMEWLYSGLEEYKYITIRSIIFQFLSLFFLFIFVKTEQDIEKYAFFGVIATVGSNICNFIHSRKIISFKTNKKLKIKKHLKPIFIIFSMSIAGSIYLMLDSTMLGFVKGDREVGIYTAATKLTKLIISVIASVSTVLLPRLSYYAEKDNDKDFKEIFNKSLLFILCLALPIMFGEFILSKQMIYIVSGIQYYDSILPTRIMTPIIIFISIASLLNGSLIALRKEKIVLYAQISAAFINFSINLFLIPKIGAIGAAIGTVIAEFLVTTIEFIALKKYILIKDFLFNFIQFLISSIIMSISVLLCISFTNNMKFQFIFSTIVGIIVYGVTLILLKNQLLLYAKSLITKKIRKN